MEHLLKARGIAKRFGGVQALKNIDIELHPNEVLGLVGPNGAGKTTLINVVSGMFKSDEGKILYLGNDISGRPPEYIARQGLVRTFQATVNFTDLTAIENIYQGLHQFCYPNFWQALGFGKKNAARQKEMVNEAQEILELIGLGEFKDQKAGQLPYGHQKSLGLGIALAAKPKVLFLDEPVAGMNREETLVMADLIKKINEMGISILVVEHDMDFITKVCDRVMVMEYGQKIFEGKPDGLWQDKRVVEAYLGFEDF